MSYKKLYNMKCILLKNVFKAVQKWYIRAWGVSKLVVCLILTMFICEAISKSNTLMMFGRN